MAILESLLLTLEKRRPRPLSSTQPNPYLDGNFAPVGHELDSPPLEVIAGAIPPSLRGTLYRMSPAPRFEPPNRGLYHWFDGDGMIDAFFVDGSRDGAQGRAQVVHKNRWVRTEKLALEERAGRALFGGLRDLISSTSLEGFLGLGFTAGELLSIVGKAMLGHPPTEQQIARILRAMDRSNTNIQLLAGHLLTLVEGAAAHEIDPQTLATLGRFDFGGVIDPTRGGMVAHPKVDAATSTIYTFGYFGDRGAISYYVIGSDGMVRIKREFATPFAAMMHDFSVTETRAIFYHMPAVLHLDEISNPNSIRWEPSRGARLGLVDRDSPNAPLRWLPLPTCYIFHPLNAYDDGEAVVLDVVKYSRLPFFDSGGETLNPVATEYPPGQLVRLRLQVATGQITETLIDDAPVEFPVCDPRYATRRHRHGWVAARRGTTCGRGSFNALGHVDYQTETVRYRTLGPSSYTSEALFVPRAAEAGEGDGYLLATVYHAEQDVSDLLILDSLQIDAAPLAVVRTKTRVPYGFHGTWVPASPA